MALRKWLANSALVQGLTPKPRQALPTELFPGVEKPSVTLAHMLCAEMLQHLDVNVPAAMESGHRRRSRTVRFPKFTVTESETYDSYNGGTGNITSTVAMTDGSNPFGPAEHKIILAGYKVFTELRGKRLQAKKEEDRQQQSLDLIAAYFTPIEPEPKPCKPAVSKSKTDAGPPPSALDALLSPVS